MKKISGWVWAVLVVHFSLSVSSIAYAYLPSESFLLNQTAKSRSQIKLVTLYGTVKSAMGAVDEEWTLDFIKGKSSVLILKPGTRQLLNSKMNASLTDLSVIGRAWAVLGVSGSRALIDVWLKEKLPNDHLIKLKQVNRTPFFAITDSEGGDDVALKISKKDYRIFGADIGTLMFSVLSYSSDASISFPKKVEVKEGSDFQFDYNLRDFKVGKGMTPAQKSSDFLDPGMLDLATLFIEKAR